MKEILEKKDWENAAELKISKVNVRVKIFFMFFVFIVNVFIYEMQLFHARL